MTEISFLDLVEVRVVAAMRKAGITLQAIRFAMTYAQERLGIERPLTSREFKTTGSEVLMSAIEDDGELVSLSRKNPGQKVFKKIVSQSLNDLEYEGSVAARWRPKGFAQIVIDPNRNFGDPLLDEFGVSTKLISEEFSNFDDLDYLARMYEIPKDILKTGILFENQLDEAYGQNSI